MNAKQVRIITRLTVPLTFVTACALFPAIAQGKDAASPEQQVRNAAAYGDLGAIKRLLAAGVDIDAKDFSGMTALMYSAWAGRQDR